MSCRWNVDQWIEYQRKRQLIETVFQCLTSNFSNNSNNYNNGNYGPQSWQKQVNNGSNEQYQLYNGQNWDNDVGQEPTNNFWQDDCTNLERNQCQNFSQIAATNFGHDQGNNFMQNQRSNFVPNQGNNFRRNQGNNLGQRQRSNFGPNSGNNNRQNRKVFFTQNTQNQKFRPYLKKSTQNSRKSTNSNQKALIAEMYDTKANLEILKQPPKLPKPPRMVTKDLAEQQKQNLLWKQYRAQVKPLKNKEYANAKRSVQRLGKLDYNTLDEKQRFRLDGAREVMARMRREGMQKQLAAQRNQESKNAKFNKTAEVNRQI